MNTDTPFLITIFIPTYNRARLIHAPLESLEAISRQDFEVIVVDDGSTDGTEAIIRQWQQRVAFPLRYLYQPNQGKHIAHNTAVAAARGRFFMTLDSDDSVLPNAIETIERHWQAIPEDQREQFAGVAGMCLRENGELSGEPYPRAVMDASYLDIFQFCRMNGERREAIRTAVLKQYPYPRIAGERHVRPTLILKRMAHKYLLRFTNEVLQINRHAPDGICANRFRYRMKNPRGMRLFYLEDLTLHYPFIPRRELRHRARQYVRFSLHSGVGPAQQLAEIKNTRIWLVAFVPGAFAWVVDRVKRRLRGV